MHKILEDVLLVEDRSRFLVYLFGYHQQAIVERLGRRVSQVVSHWLCE